MRKKIIAILVLALFVLPALSGAKSQNANNPFDRIWNAVGSIQVRLDSQEKNSANQQAENKKGMENLQGQIDDLSCRLGGGDTCAIGGGESGDGNGGSEAENETLHCGMGVCSRSVQKYVGGVLQECVPGEPVAEVCDGLDNDCDGVSDESPDNSGSVCQAE
ncbi:MAG: putative metal-binding motif-containing protein [Patescibacteria group bacterium]